MEMSTRNIPGGKGRPARKADNLTAICELIIYKMWDPQHLTSPWASTAWYMETFTSFTSQVDEVGGRVTHRGIPEREKQLGRTWSRLDDNTKYILDEEFSFTLVW
jgi:hypothetical protein